MFGLGLKLLNILLILWQPLLRRFTAKNAEVGPHDLYNTASQHNNSKINCQSLHHISSMNSKSDCSESGCYSNTESDKLCHKCIEGCSMAIGSNECIECSDVHLALITFFIAAGLLLVFFIKTLNMTVSQGTINGLIFYANVVWAYDSFFLPKIDSGSGAYFLKVFLAWLNLDFGIETCFFKGLDCYWKTRLQFVFPLYLWTIAIVIIVLSHYSQRMTEVFGTNSIQVLATPFLLSHAKFLRTIVTAVLPYPADQSGNHTSWASNKDLPYCNLKHGMLFGVAICVLLLLWLPYTLTLLFIQPLRSCSHFHLCRLVNKLTPLFDAYTGPFNPKSHFWVGLLCLVRGILLLVYALTHYFYKASISSLALVITTMLLLLVLYCTGRPYRDVKRLTIFQRYSFKVSFLSMLEISFLLNLASLSIGMLSVDYVFSCSAIDRPRAKIAMFCTSVGITFIQFIGIFWWHVWKFIVAYRLRKARESYRDLDHNAVDTEVANAQTATSIVIPANSTFTRNSAHIRESILTDGSHS